LKTSATAFSRSSTRVDQEQTGRLMKIKHLRKSVREIQIFERECREICFVDAHDKLLQCPFGIDDLV
jgi:hypothetical protein